MAESVRSVQKDKFRAYFRKAEQFHSAMNRSLDEDEWNGATLTAVHCAISSFDALTVYHLGSRSSGQRHEDVVKLVRQTKIAGVEDKIKQFLDVIRLKNLVEYDADEPSENDATRACLQADRLFSWVKSNLEI